MAKGLNKAERHALRREVRGWPRVWALKICGEPPASARVIMAELRKRGFRYDDFRQCWTIREPWR